MLSIPKRASSGLEREDKADCGAVRIGHDVAAGLPAPALLLDQIEMVGVDLRHDERYIGCHAKGAGVRDHCASGGGKLRLKFLCDVGIKRGEDDVRQLAGGAFGHVGLQRHPGDVTRQRGVELPPARFTISLARAAVACCQPRNVEPRMIVEQLNKSLANHSGRAQNAYIPTFHDASRITCCRHARHPRSTWRLENRGLRFRFCVSHDRLWGATSRSLRACAHAAPWSVRRFRPTRTAPIR